MSKNYYINKNGDCVFKAEYYKQRGTCCRSGCLHCPFGFTLKKFGIEALKIDDESIAQEAKELYTNKVCKDSVTASLLSGAFGGTKTLDYNNQNYLALTLKGYFCGLAELKNERLSEFYLNDYFSNQGISEVHVRLAIENFLL